VTANRESRRWAGLWLVLALFVVAAGAGCTTTQDEERTLEPAAGAGADRALEATRGGAAVAIDETRDAAGTVADATTDAARQTAGTARAIAGAAARTTRAAVSATGETITDGWITARVSARFVDEDLLAGSDIDVDVDDRVVTLTGRVGSEAARARAVTIAGDTEGVERVVNRLVVTAR
jgi:hyperosmotically inducible protein